MYSKFLAPFLGALAVAGLTVGCQDLPVETDGTSGFPLEKLDVVTGDASPEVEFHVREFGFDRAESDKIVNGSVRDRGANIRAGRGDRDVPVRGNDGRSDHARDDAAAVFRRALASLDLTERQIAAIGDCYERYRACIESARNRARAAREGHYGTFRTTVARIRNAAAEGTITREEARRHMIEAIHEYRGAVLALHRALRGTEAECVASLRDCIEAALTREQIARFRELIERAHDNGGDRDGDGTGDNGRDGDHADGDRGGDRGGDNSGGDNGRDGDHVDGDRGGDRGGDDSGDDRRRDSVRNGRGG